jgi:hypothetical protein
MTKKNSKPKPEPAKTEETKTEETKVEETKVEDSNEEKGPQEVPVSYIKGRRHNTTGPIGSRRPR